jgi:hypothetical protein
VSDENSGDPVREGETVNERRRRLLQLTLGGTAFAAPLMVSFGLDGVNVGGAVLAGDGNQCQNEWYPLLQSTSFEASIDREGKLVLTLDAPTACEGDSIFAVLLNGESYPFAGADVEARYGCATPSGLFPRGANVHDRTVTGSVEANGITFSTVDGKVTARMILEPPPPDDVSPCTARGLRPALRAVTYSNITFIERGRGIFTSPAPTTVSATFSKTWWAR